MWKQGIITTQGQELTYCAKVYDEPSQFGINQGRISKLEVRQASDRKLVLNYDRGWDIKPETEDAKKALQLILAYYK